MKVRKNAAGREARAHAAAEHTSMISAQCMVLDVIALASPSTDNTIRIWDSETGRCLQTLEGHSDWVDSVAFDRQTQCYSQWES